MKYKLSTYVITLMLTTLLLNGCGQPKEKPGEDWTTYTNEKYGYSFDYPADCTFGPMPKNCKSKPPEERAPECLCFLNSQNPDQVFMQTFLGEGDKLILAGMSVDHPDSTFFNPPAGTELIPWLKSEFSQMYEDIPAETNYEVDGVPAVKIYTSSSPMAISYEDVYFILDGKLIKIQLQDLDNEDSYELLKQILTSFQIE